MNKAGSNSARTVERTAQILRALADGGCLRVSDLASATELPKGTIDVLIRALAATGMVERSQASERYRLGPALVQLGSSYLRADELRACAASWARLLALDTRHVVQVGSLHGTEVLIVNHVGRVEDAGYSFGLGWMYPADQTAIGKVLLAFNHDTADQHVGLSDRSEPGGQSNILDDFAQVREQGWAVRAGVNALNAELACPIRDRSSGACGAIGITGEPTQILDAAAPRPELLERVRAAATAVSRAIGGSVW
jgi:DNA-binding IclR family transcriptional regulator